MNKVILVVVLVVLVVFVVIFFSSSPFFFTPSLRVSEPLGEVPMPSETGLTDEPVSQTPVVIEFTSGGFSPATVTVSRGTTVRFVNRDSVMHWPASGVHPAHQVCPGFDALRGLANGEAYEFTFGASKTCPMHDHLNPATRGSIVVE